MSLHGKIDLRRPLTQDEKNALLSRPGGRAQIAANDREFGDLSDEDRSALQVSHEEDVEEDRRRLEEYLRAEDEEGFDEEDVAKVINLSVTDLRAWLKKNGLDQTGSLQELQLRVLEAMEDARQG